MHLYYLWRGTHHDHSLLEDAPGHLFLDHEYEDCVTLTYLALLFGWGIECGAPLSGKAAYIDHDGHAILFVVDGVQLADAKRLFRS